MQPKDQNDIEASILKRIGELSETGQEDRDLEYRSSFVSPKYFLWYFLLGWCLAALVCLLVSRYH